MAESRKSKTSPHKFSCQMRDHSEWSVLTEDELNFLNLKKVCRKYARGVVVIHEGDSCRGIYCVESGLIGIRKTNADGNSVLLGRLAGAGSTFGYRPLLAKENHRASAEIMKESIICFIEKKAVWELLSHNPNLGLKFLQMATRDLGKAEEEILQLSTLDLRTRFVHLLLVFMKHYGTVSRDGMVKLELPLSRRDLAAMVGARPETITRVIRKIEEDGIAEFSGRMVTIPEVLRLHKEIEHEHHI